MPAGDGAAPEAADDSGGPSTDGPDALADRLGHRFADRALLMQALAHRSWCSESGGAASNERLEFLGDAVLGLVVAGHCFDAYPDLPEGALAKVRAAVVNTAVLAEVAAELGVGEHLLLGRGEDASGGRRKASILANTVEALIGAAYLDGGWPAASALVLRLLGRRIEEAAAGPGADDFKTRLQELVVRTVGELPRYEVSGSGPDHARHYRATVLVAGQPTGEGEGRSKKDAEQAAARQAWRQLAQVDTDGDGAPAQVDTDGDGAPAQVDTDGDGALAGGDTDGAVDVPGAPAAGTGVVAVPAGQGPALDASDPMPGGGVLPVPGGGDGGDA